MGSTTLLIVNGSSMLFLDKKEITYQQVLKLLGIENQQGFSIVYTKGKNNSSGGLSEGESIEVVDFMRFNVDRTTNA